ncbi:MAG TPA: enoyl-CoA hydratase/isomerase family protein [Smithella sp.]|jgi:enoyl-CoA hydratase/carnithine racemase|nr:enoyl-CoA hydratase/isomerase family protein [Smithella sp.]OQC52168.1 MAG: putative enoyl-CoA hydratase echA8 [Deltaproteobacteria bacterium ADurb.Bin022]HNQ64736.1 enoyl-CoA hydratase/isomerase family protein [Smithella sp.]HOE32349.1 enoyl-CoA hydratase/isomerase family protein [Smithella sp.]HOG08954.1 enoyl-CoA hydratase/isomerase family protein [Smithella sp.]
MTYHSLIVEKKKKYAVIKLNRPHEMNAISKEMHQELYDVFADLETDSDVRAVVLTGGEYVFSAGMDIKEMNNLPDKESDKFLKSMMMYLKKIYAFKKPVIAAVGGIALGGGFNLVTVCDLVVASESAIFCHPELKFGFNPFFYPLSQIVGITKAKEIVMLGEPIGANEAMKLGLVNKVEPPERFMEVAESIADTLSQRSPRAFEELKNLCSIVPRMDKMAAMDIESSICALLFTRDERKEQMREVLSKDKSGRK